MSEISKEMDVTSEECARDMKDTKEKLLECWEEAKKGDIYPYEFSIDGMSYKVTLNSKGNVFLSKPDSNDEDSRDWSAVYSSIDIYLMHINNGNPKKYPERLGISSEFLSELNLINFEDPREFYVDNLDGTGHRPGPFGPRGWEKGIIVCSNRQIQEIRKRIDQGEPFTEEIVLEVNPLIIYKTFEAYCLFHKPTVFAFVGVETPTPDESGVILNPDRPKWITEADFFKSHGELWPEDIDKIKKVFSYITEEEVHWIENYEDDRFIEKKGLGYLNFCKRHGIEIPKWIFEGEKKFREKIDQKNYEIYLKYQNDPEVKKAVEKCKKEVENSDRNDVLFYTDEIITMKEDEKADKQDKKDFEELVKETIADEKAGRRFHWGGSVIDIETLEIYMNPNDPEIQYRKQHGIKNYMSEIK